MILGQPSSLQFEYCKMPSASGWRSLSYNNGIYVATDYDSAKIAYSTDGARTFTEVSLSNISSTSTRTFSSVVLSNGYVIVQTDKALILFEDISNSSQYNVLNNNVSNALSRNSNYRLSYSPSYSDNYVMFTGYGNTPKYLYYTLENNIIENYNSNWDQVGPIAPQGRKVSFIPINDGLIFISAGSDVNDSEYQSLYGMNLNDMNFYVELPISGVWLDFCMNRNLMPLQYYEENPCGVIIGYQSNSACYFKLDSSTHPPVQAYQTTLPISSNWYRCCYGNSRYIAISNTGKSAYSEDGINWNEGGPIPSGAESIVYNGSEFVIIGNIKDYIYFSIDGINWYQKIKL